MSGKVYFVSAPGRIKIGYTRQPERRLQNLRAADMEPLTVIAVIDGSRRLEATIHDLVDAHRLRGEWFKDCEQVRAIIRQAIDGEIALDDEIVEPAKPATRSYLDVPDVARASFNAALAECSAIAEQMLLLSLRHQRSQELCDRLTTITDTVLEPLIKTYPALKIH